MLFSPTPKFEPATIRATGGLPQTDAAAGGSSETVD